MVPRDVLSRRDISATAKIVWEAMSMLSIGLGRVNVSHVAIANACGSARGSVIDGIHQLEFSGLVKKDGNPVNQIQSYLILGERKRGKGSNRKAPASPTAKPLVECANCLQMVGGLMPDQLCRRCHAEAKVRRISLETVLHREAVLKGKEAAV